ncbi:MAG: HNH endonuclease family protein, partial [Bradyrhizobium sp.]
LYHYVGLRKREALKVAHVFEEFKMWWESQERNTDQELTRVAALATQFQVCIVPDQKTRFGLFCRRMKLLDTATQTPLLFHLLEHHAPDSSEFISMLTDIESYFVRRFVCGLTTKSYNRVFLDRLLSEMVAEEKADAPTLRAKLLALEGDSQLWPSDEKFGIAWSRRQLYEGRNSRKVRAILEALEFSLRTSKQEFMPELDSLSVEHVLPQGWKPQDWPLPADTAEAKEARARLLHSLGNLTLVTSGFNSSLSNVAFSLKRPELAANSSLMLNAYFQKFKDADPWDEETIVARAESLFGRACTIWPYPAKA